MSDNFIANPGAAGDTFAADDIGGVKFPRSKLIIGADGTNDGDVSAANPLPVTAILTTGAATVGKVDQGTAGASKWVVTADIAAAQTLATVTTVGTVTAVTAITNALPAGTNAIGKLAANSGVDIGDVDVTSISAGTNTIGGVTPRPETANGLLISRNIDLDNGTLDVVKNSAGQLYGWDITNRGTVTVYVKFYDATSGTLGTGTPVLTIGIPGNASDNTLSSKSLAYGIAFGTGICVGAGTGFADNDNTDPGANIVVSNVYYK